MSRPTRVGRYRLEEVIGVGSFATVHRAVDERLDDAVVVKVLAENHSLHPEIRERFIAEGRALRRIRSPHVVAVHDIGETDRQQPYLVLDLADRGTLADRVSRRRAEGRPVEPSDVLTVARTLAAAVDAVHAARLVHRDLSPSNVLLRSIPGHRRNTGTVDLADPLVRADEELLLADLGMSKDLALSSGLTVAGGTEGFRPPEQRTPGEVDGRADLWALSALVRWMTEGVALPPAMDRVIDRGLSERPADRQPDATTWLAELEQALAPTPTVHEPVEVTPDRTRRPGNGTRRTAAAAAVVVALVSGVLLGSFLDGRGDRDPVAALEGATLAVSGPETATIGRPITFTAEVNGVDSWVWTLPSGEHVVDADAVTVTARSPGRAEITLRARTPSGRDLETSHSVTVGG